MKYIPCSIPQCSFVRTYHQTAPVLFYRRFLDRGKGKVKKKKKEEEDQEIDAKIVEEKLTQLEKVKKPGYKIRIPTYESTTDRYINRIFKKAEEQGEKTEETFNTAIKIYKLNAGLYVRGHIEFGDLALSKLEEYELQYNLEVYKMIFSIFPEGKYLPKSKVDAEFIPFPRQQDAALRVLTKMFDNGTYEDNMGYHVLNFLRVKMLICILENNEFLILKITFFS